MLISVRNVFTPNNKRIEKALRDYLKRNLSPARYEHSLSVALFAASLAGRFGFDPEKGLIAGLGHDMAREIPYEKLLPLIKDGLPLSPLEAEKPVLLHGRAAACLLRSRFGLNDEEILHAVRHHTLGHPELGDTGKILFIADYLEPARKFIDDGFRAKALGLGLDEMILAVVDHSAKREKTLAAITKDMYDALRGKKR